MGTIDALYIYDEHNNPIVERVYHGRPSAASDLLQLYLAIPLPRPSLTYLPNAVPATILFSLVQDRLLFLVPASGDHDPLQVLEFLHRVADALEEFLGAPLLASKIESNYDIVTQIVNEVSDAGLVSNTEVNALKEIVEVPNWVGNLLGNIQTPSLQAPGSAFSNLSTPGAPAVPAVPWRRANVKHTSNELYVDIVEKLSVILAPSGRPISAFAHGSIAFNAKISGVPDLLLRLTAPGGKAGFQRAMDLLSFHQCVRLARWREHPGELSFIPPDGRFVLAGYECDLLPDIFDSPGPSGSIPSPSLVLPATLEMSPFQGPNEDELEVRLLLPQRNSGSKFGGYEGSSSALGALSSNAARANGGSNGSSANSSSNQPLEDIVISVPIPADVRNITDIKCNRGEANFSPTEASLEWRISSREAASLGPIGATMRCTIVGLHGDHSGQSGLAKGLQLKTDAFDYDESLDGASADRRTSTEDTTNGIAAPDSSKQISLSNLMPKSASLSFAVRGWLPSGIKVDSLSVNTKTSKGLGAGVTPYKGVKYHTVSKQGVEVRC